MKDFHINKYFFLRLEENGEINIYVNKELFRQCKYLLLNPITPDEIPSFIENFKSIDEEAEKLDHALEVNLEKVQIPPETEFWAHCSNLQVWEESNYDSSLLHSNLSFPLLKKLSEVGDSIAQVKLKNELAKRLFEGNVRAVYFLLTNGYLRYLSSEEIEAIFLDSNERLKSEVFGVLKAENDTKKFALSIMKILAELGDGISQRKLQEEFKNHCRKHVSSWMDENEALLWQDYYKFLKNETVVKMLLDDEEAKIVLGLNAELQKAYNINTNEELQNVYNLDEFSLILRPIIEEDDEYYGKPYNENLAMIIYRDNIVDLYIKGGENFRLIELPKSVAKLKFLKVLNLSYNYIREIPPEIINLHNLEKLILSGNIVLETISDKIWNLKNLIELDLSGNNVSTIHNSIKPIKSLKKIDLSHNKLSFLPDSFSNLKFLEVLSLASNRFKELPESIKKLKNLKYLNIIDNKSLEIPEFLNELNNLSEVWIDSSYESLEIIKNLKRKGIIINLISYN